MPCTSRAGKISCRRSVESRGINQDGRQCAKQSSSSFMDIATTYCCKRRGGTYESRALGNIKMYIRCTTKDAVRHRYKPSDGQNTLRPFSMPKTVLDNRSGLYQGFCRREFCLIAERLARLKFHNQISTMRLNKTHCKFLSS